MLNLPVQIKKSVQVMSSVDLAKLCVGDAKDAHSNFMKKAKLVLGERIKYFYEFEKYSRGTRKILLLPERETYLMAMSYSYELQACVFDEWQKIKNEQQKVPDWVRNLSPEAKLAIEDMSKQIDETRKEVDRLQGVCQTMAAQFSPGTTPHIFCKQLNGVNVQLVNSTLINLGMLSKTKRGIEPTSYARDRYFKVAFKEEFNKKTNWKGTKANTTLTLAGAKWIYRAYLSGKLPMKKSWDRKYVHLEFEAK